MHSLLTTASKSELFFIAGLDYGQKQDQHFAALQDLIFQRNGHFQAGDNWFPYEVIELGANGVQVGHEREFVICSLLVIHAVKSGFDTWTDLTEKFSNSNFSNENLSVEFVDLLLDQYATAACQQSG
jgi:hypothetical protein